METIVLKGNKKDAVNGKIVALVGDLAEVYEKQDSDIKANIKSRGNKYLTTGQKEKSDFLLTFH
ncbi:MAG: hypothetical protein V4511_00010 [Bacteroidota bacterium]